MIYYLLFTTFFIISGFFTFDLLLKEPSVWPDEAIYADVARNIIQEGRFGTDLWKGLIPGVERMILWYPPLFFYSLAVWLKAFGVSIVTLRLFSIFLSILVVLSFYLLLKLFSKSSDLHPFKKNWLILGSIVALSTNTVFLNAAKISRPEIMMLLFACLSVYFFLKPFSKNLMPGYLLSGIFASLAFLTHFIGIYVFGSLITYYLLTERLKIIRIKNFYVFLISFLVPILIWLLFVSPHFDLLKEQLFPVLGRKNLEEPWIITEMKNPDLAQKLVYPLYLFFSAAFTIYSFFKRTKENTILSLLLIFSWLFAITGRMGWYLSLPIPFVYLAVAVLSLKLYENFQKLPTARNKKLLLIGLILFFSTLFLNLKIRSDRYFSMLGENYSYENYTRDIQKLIAPGHTVFLSAIPDPYFAFADNLQNYKLFEFPPLGDSVSNYLKVLDQSDYIVYNSHYEFYSFGNLLPVYLEKNLAVSYQVGSPGQYQTLVIKLKPLKERVVPEKVNKLLFK